MARLVSRHKIVSVTCDTKHKCGIKVCKFQESSPLFVEVPFRPEQVRIMKCGNIDRHVILFEVKKGEKGDPNYEFYRRKNGF